MTPEKRIAELEAEVDRLRVIGSDAVEYLFEYLIRGNPPEGSREKIRAIIERWRGK